MLSTVLGAEHVFSKGRLECGCSEPGPVLMLESQRSKTHIRPPAGGGNVSELSGEPPAQAWWQAAGEGGSEAGVAVSQRGGDKS